MNQIGQWQLEHELDDDQMAAFMSERLGRPITPHGVHTIARRKNPPVLWLETLELAPRDPAHGSGSEDVGGPGQQASPPSGPKSQPPPAIPLPFEPVSVEEQIRTMYVLAGKGASIVLQSPEVADVWALSAPNIARAYIEWARHSPKVANVLAAMTLGGPAGQLVLMHGSLLASTLIVSGRLPVERFIPPPQGAANGDVPADEPQTAEQGP